MTRKRDCALSGREYDGAVSWTNSAAIALPEYPTGSRRRQWQRLAHGGWRHGARAGGAAGRGSRRRQRRGGHENNAVVMTEGTYIAPNGVITGTGTLAVNFLGLQNDGTLAPGITVNTALASTGSQESIARAQDVAGTLTVTGTLTMGPTGRVEIPVIGKNAGQYGSLSITGTAQLDGVLALDFGNSYAPHQGDTFTLLTRHRRPHRRLRQRGDQRPAARPRLSIDHRQRTGAVQVAGRAAEKDFPAAGAPPALNAQQARLLRRPALDTGPSFSATRGGGVSGGLPRIHRTARTSPGG
jgi:hypothetical protein